MAFSDPVDRWARSVEEALEEDAFQRDPEFLEKLIAWMRPWNRWFDAEVRGLERVPDEPCLLVGNHSGGSMTPDTSALFAAWYDHFGMERPLVGLAFDAAFAIPGLATIMRKMGEVPANAENAGRALAAGASVIVYPGGDYDAFRPWSDRHRIDFGGRKGFVRLALRRAVPVVPVVGQGGHNALVVLSRGEAWAERLGLGRLRMDVAPIVWQLPWGVSLGGVPYLPLPVKVQLECCEPLDWRGYGPEAADDPAIVERCYDEIVAVMQARLTEMAEENPFPLVRRLRALLARERTGSPRWRG